MDPKNLPENPTKGVVRRTLRGMDGRIAHVETLADRWSPKRIDDAIAAAVAPLMAEIEALRDALAITAKDVGELMVRTAPVPDENVPVVEATTSEEPVQSESPAN